MAGDANPSLQQLLDVLNEIRGDVKSTKADVHDLKEDSVQFREKLSKQDESHQKLVKVVETLQLEISSMKNSEKARNIIFFNVPDTDCTNGNLLSTVEKIFVEITANIPISCISNVYRLGKEMGKRPIVVCFTGVMWKHNVFRNIAKLKPLGISVGDDLSHEERAARSQLVETYKKLKNSGASVKLRRDKLLYGGKLFTCDSVSELENTLSSTSGTDGGKGKSSKSQQQPEKTKHSNEQNASSDSEDEISKQSPHRNTVRRSSRGQGQGPGDRTNVITQNATVSQHGSESSAGKSLTKPPKDKRSNGTSKSNKPPKSRKELFTDTPGTASIFEKAKKEERVTRGSSKHRA